MRHRADAEAAGDELLLRQAATGRWIVLIPVNDEVVTRFVAERICGESDEGVVSRMLNEADQCQSERRGERVAVASGVRC